MAKKKTQKISVNTMDEIMKRCQNTEVVEWNGLQVVIKKTLTLEEMLCFANSVVKSCFDQGDGSYLPEVKDFAIRSNIMERYANFALPSNLDKQYDMVIRSGAVEMIMNYINFSQFSELMKAIDAKIQNTADAHRCDRFTKEAERIDQREDQAEIDDQCRQRQRTVLQRFQIRKDADGEKASEQRRRQKTGKRNIQIARGNQRRNQCADHRRCGKARRSCRCYGRSQLRDPRRYDHRYLRICQL